MSSRPPPAINVTIRSDRRGTCKGTHLVYACVGYCESSAFPSRYSVLVASNFTHNITSASRCCTISKDAKVRRVLEVYYAFLVSSGGTFGARNRDNLVAGQRESGLIYSSQSCCRRQAESEVTCPFNWQCVSPQVKVRLDCPRGRHHDEIEILTAKACRCDMCRKSRYWCIGTVGCMNIWMERVIVQSSTNENRLTEKDHEEKVVSAKKWKCETCSQCCNTEMGNSRCTCTCLFVCVCVCIVCICVCGE